MNRAPFRLPDWTRVSWATGQAEAVWAPRIQRAASIWQLIERESVLAGLRRAALQHVSPEDLPAASALAAQAGLVLTPLAREGVAASYSASARAVNGGPWQYRVALTRPEHAAAAAAAWGDDEALGRLLGYPPCCRAFFRRVWVAEHWVDTTWAMAAEGSDGPPEASVLLRWLGVRLVPHLPCSFRCGPSAALGGQLAQLGCDLGYAEEVRWLLDMLRWPAEWTALHGVGLLTTPVCRVSFCTDATSERLVVQRAGTSYPEEGARGLRFPYQLRGQGSAAQPPRADPVPAAGIPSWRVNGFGTRRVQEGAHRLVLRAARDLQAPGQVLDLGAGDGLLVQRLAAQVGGEPLAVEVEPFRAGAAVHRLGAARVSLDCLSRHWPGGPQYALVALMPGRLAELGPEKAAVVVDRLAAATPRLLLYGYGHWLEEGLLQLAARVGLGAWRPAHEPVVGATHGLGVAAVVAVRECRPA